VRPRPFILGFALALVLLGLWALEAIVRGGTCGSSEGGGSCETGVVSWLLLAGAFAAAAAAVVTLVRSRRRR
jgi:hypothetical protein